MVHISTSFGSSGTIQTLSNLLQERMKYMKETARDSIAAMAINVLRGIRTVTKVAKKSTIKVDVKKEGTLYPSCYSVGRAKKLCVRVKGTKARYQGNEIIVAGPKAPLKNQHVFRYSYLSGKEPKHYLIIAASMGEAKKHAKRIAMKKGLRFAGLAKRALSILMFKTNTKRVNDGNLNPLVENKADELTNKRENVQNNGDNGGTYTLTLMDELKYALLAVKGGKATLNNQMKKAANKIASIINQKIPDGATFFGTKKLPTPFPEVKQRKTE